MIDLVLGKTSHIETIFVRDTTNTTQVVGLSGLTSATTGLTFRRHVVGGAGSSAITIESVDTQGSYQAPTDASSVRFTAIDDTNLPGWYELHFHNDWLGTKGQWGFRLFNAANMEQVIRTFDVQHRLHSDMGALPTDIPNETTGELWDWAKAAYLASLLGYEVEPGATPKQLTLFAADGTTPIFRATVSEQASPTKVSVSKLGTA